MQEKKLENINNFENEKIQSLEEKIEMLEKQLEELELEEIENLENEDLEDTEKEIEELKAEKTTNEVLNEEVQTAATNNIKIDYRVRKRKIRRAFVKMSAMALLLIVSTYAWFTTQNEISLSNLSGKVEVAENMEISLDALSWHQEIDLSDATTVFSEAYASKLNVDPNYPDTTMLPDTLDPVSSAGEYGTGAKLIPFYKGTAIGTTLKDIKQCVETEDNGYYAFDIYIRNNSKSETSDTLQLNLNSSVQVLQSAFKKDANSVAVYGTEGTGLENGVRVALALYDNAVDSGTSTQASILEATKNSSIKDVTIWEPNAYSHTETACGSIIRYDASGEMDPFADGEYVNTYALNATAITGDKLITRIYDITESKTTKQMTLATNKTGDDNFKILSNSGNPWDLKSITSTDATAVPFKIESNKVSKLRVYVWLEGQDVDCINQASFGGGIELDLGLTKDNEVGDVLTREEIDFQVTAEVTDASAEEVKVTVRANTEIELPDNTWNYETTAVAKEEVYRVASVEPVKVAADPVVNKKVIYKTFTGDVSQNIEITGIDGKKGKLQFSITDASTGTAIITKTKYSTVNATTGSVTVTIVGDKELTLPDGWEYANTEKNEIRKTYTENTTEDVVIKDAAGNTITTVPVKIENITEETGTEEAATLISQIKDADKSVVYGQYTTYPVDIDDVTTNADGSTDYDWKIFYNDDNYVYLIADDYVLNSKCDATVSYMLDGKYAIYIEGSDYIITNNKFLFSADETLNSSYENYRTTATLLDTSKWTYFSDSNGNGNYTDDLAIDAIGGSTIEMWVASWNAKGYTKLETEYDEGGYYIGEYGNDLISDASFSIELSNNDSLYWIEDKDGDDDSLWCFSCWLASPNGWRDELNDEGYQNTLIYNGHISYADWTNDYTGLRPVVCLKTEVMAEQNEDDVWVLSE